VFLQAVKESRRRHTLRACIYQTMLWRWLGAVVGSVPACGLARRSAAPGTCRVPPGPKERWAGAYIPAHGSNAFWHLFGSPPPPPPPPTMHPNAEGGHPGATKEERVSALGAVNATSARNAWSAAMSGGSSAPASTRASSS
jgi:hypothetical protein